VLQLG